MNKKILLPIIGITLLCLILSGCRPLPLIPPQSTQTPTNAVSDPELPEAPTVEPSPTVAPTSEFDGAGQSLGGVRIHLWHAWTDETAEVLDQLERDFNGSNPWGIWLEVKSYPSYDTLEAALEPLWDQPELPEVVVAVPEQGLAWDQSRQTVVDLGPYLNDPTWGIPTVEQDDFLPAFWDQETDGSRRLGLPALGTVQVLYYNLTWARELGFTFPPVTPEEFMNQMCAAALAIREDDDWDNNGTGGWLIDTEPLTAASWISAFSGKLPEGGEEGYRFDTPETEASLTFLKDAFDKGCIWMGRKADPLGYFAGRNALVVSGSLSDGDELANTLARLGSQDEWTVLPFPSEKDDFPVVGTISGYHVLKGSPEEQLAAWLVVRWLSQPDRQARLAQPDWRLPVRVQSLDLLQNDNGQPAPWKAGAGLVGHIHAAPVDAGWAVARRVLQDAFTQLFTADTKIESIPTILEELDRTIQDLVERVP